MDGMGFMKKLCRSNPPSRTISLLICSVPESVETIVEVEKVAKFAV